MVAIFQTTSSNAFSWIKMYEFRLRFHWSLFLRFQLTISQHWFWNWLGTYQVTSHYLNQWWLVYQRIYASPRLTELKCQNRSFIFKQFSAEGSLFLKGALYIQNISLMYSCMWPSIIGHISGNLLPIRSHIHDHGCHLGKIMVINWKYGP